ncbi:MAG: glycosyltransferase [bacterium]
MIRNRISVIIPYKEPAPFLKETLKSLKSQSIYPDLDIIVIKDNGNGVSATRNRGLRNVKGEFIYFIDADDVLANKDVLGKARDVLICNKELDFLYGDMIISDEQLQAIEYQRTPLFHGEHLSDYLIHGGAIMLQSMLFRNNNGEVWFDQQYKMQEDLDYILRRTYKRTGLHIGRPFIIYRKHADSLTQKREPNKADEIIKTMQIYRNFLLANPELIRNKVYFKKIIVKQSLIRIHILHTFYYRKEALALLLKIMKYFPLIISKKFLRVVMEFFIPAFLAKIIRVLFKKIKKIRYQSKNTYEVLI